MSKAIEGAAMLGGAVLMGAAAFMDPALIASPLFDKIWASLIIGGMSMEAGAIGDALTSNRGTNVTTRTPAALRQIVYGEQRVGGVEVYRSTTGSHKSQYNHIIVLADHEMDSIVNLYLDGRQVHWQVGPAGNTTRNGVNFGGSADGGTYIGPNGQHYNFGTLVYCEARFGDQANGDWMTSINANDPIWGPQPGGTPYLGGCTYVYLKIEYDTAMFPSPPEIRFTVRGKNNILDPRTGLRGYTNNWALVVADVLTDAHTGLGDDSVNQAQLIAAANVCDEQVPLANGNTESRYTCNWHYDTATAPGDALSTMMPAAAGRLSRIGGEWYIWPAYWQGPTFSFDEGDLTAEMQWTATRSTRELYNRVNGTYTAPNYPYNVAGNQYDRNGWYFGTTQDNFPFAFQPTNYPQYAADVLHGYAADEYLLEDGGVPHPQEVAQQCVLSVAQAQRVAKIMLLRNRQQGTGQFSMSMSAWKMQPCDVMQFTFAANGWNVKLLEINSVSFTMDTGGPGSVPMVNAEFGVNETSSSVYEWSVTEELTVYDVPASPPQTPYIPAAPTNVATTSTAATAITGADGIVRPQIEITWDTPFDILTKQIQVQYQLVGATTWLDEGLVDISSNLAFVSGVVAGQTYNVRIRGLRANGVGSAWVQATQTVSSSYSVLGSTALSPNSAYNTGNNAIVDSIVEGGAATIRVHGPGGVSSSFTRYVGSRSYVQASAHITGEAFSTEYFVVYDTVAGTYSATTDFNATLGDTLAFIGAVVTCQSTYTSGTTGAGSYGGGGSGAGGGRNPLTYAPL